MLCWTTRIILKDGDDSMYDGYNLYSLATINKQQNRKDGNDTHSDYPSGKLHFP